MNSGIRADRSSGGVVGKTISYIVFTTWALITVLPLIPLFTSVLLAGPQFPADIVAQDNQGHAYNHDDVRD